MISEGLVEPANAPASAVAGCCHDCVDSTRLDQAPRTAPANHGQRVRPRLAARRMISATAAPARFEAAYSCGPVRLVLTFDDRSLRDALHGLLSQYDAPWSAPATIVHVTVGNGTAPRETAKPSGTYLRLHRLSVDWNGSRLLSLGSIGVWMEFDPAASRAGIAVPVHPDSPALVEEIEQQFVLLLARSWAQEGWTPLHAGSLVLQPVKPAACSCARRRVPARQL